MQTTSTVMQAAIDAHDTTQSNDLGDLFEVYASDYAPGADGFDPADAEELFCGIEDFTYLGLSYRREAVDRGDVQKFIGKSENSCTVNFSNVSRYMATWAQSGPIEGKWLVVRVISLLTSTVIADSVVIFAGRLDKPGDFGDTDASLTAVQRFGALNLQFPPRNYGPNDRTGRDPSDVLFEGFRFNSITGSLQYTERVRRQGFGGLVGLTKKITHSLQYSSHTEVSANLVVPVPLGRVQLPGHYLGTIDIGGAINIVLSYSEGPIAEYVNFRQINPKFSQPIGTQMRYGYLGGQGPVGREQIPPDAISYGHFPAREYYSRTAHIYCFVTGSTPEVDEAEAPEFVSVIKGLIVPLPDGSGDFVEEGWTHSPPYLTRFLLADPRYFNEGDEAIEDAVCIATAEHCAEFILDASQGERAFIPQADSAQQGVSFERYRSTGIMDAERIRIDELGTLSGDSFLRAIPLEPFDPQDPPPPSEPPSNGARSAYLRERYTCNATITDRVSGTDYLYNVIAPTGRLFFRRNGKGRIEILSEKPGDYTRLRGSTIVGATTIPVLDVEPWKSGLLLTQKLRIGPLSTITSEVRRVTAANYTADGNAITLTASKTGGVTVTASGATFSGGSSSVAASGTVTIGGTPAAGNTVTITINGLAVTYLLDSNDTTPTVAAMLARLIQATPHLREFIKATWTVGSGVVTLAARYGVLTLNAALANVHTGPVVNPTAAPTLAAASGGSLLAGVYYVAYSYVNSVGSTVISPRASVTVTLNQKINVTAITPLPAGATSADWYVSKAPGSTELVFKANNSGVAFSILTAPTSSNALPPDQNTTGEELLRVALSFSSNDQGPTILAQSGLTRANIHQNSFKWPLGSKQSSTNQVVGSFIDAKDDFAKTPLEVNDFDHQTQIRKVNKKEVDLSGFDNYHQASRYCNFMLSKNREGDEFAQWTTGPQGMMLEEGDLTCASSDNGGFVNYVVRVEEIRIGKAPTYTTQIVGRKYSTLMFSDNVRQHSIKLPTTLFPADSAPDTPTGLTLSEHSVTATSSTLHAEWDFEPYRSRQTARVFLMRDGEIVFSEVGIVSSDENDHGSIDIPGLPPGTHEVKVRAEAGRLISADTAPESFATTTSGTLEVTAVEVAGDQVVGARLAAVPHVTASTGTPVAGSAPAVYDATTQALIDSLIVQVNTLTTAAAALKTTQNTTLTRVETHGLIDT